MSHQFTSDHWPVARKDHRCAECGCIIPRGEKHYLQKGVLDGEWYKWRAHSDCAELYWKANQFYRGGYSVDDWMPLSEYCLSEVEQFRGMFPHAVCRLELRRELSEIAWQKKIAERAA